MDQPVHAPSPSSRPTSQPGAWPGPWAGYTAAAWAFAFAIPSLLWSSGLRVGVRSVGRDLPSYTWSNHPGVLALVLLTALLKLAGALFALALVRPSWPLPRRRLTLTGGYLLAGLLLLYGLQDIVLPGLVEAHAIAAPGNPDWYALRWHLILWGPYFAAWGLLLALATLHYQRTPRDRTADRR